jgi:hypothetical protein
MMMYLAFGGSVQAQSAGAVSVTTSFSPNVTTISTSEGAPYIDCDFWVDTPSSCAGLNTVFGYGSIPEFGYGGPKIVRLALCLSGETSRSLCNQNPPVTGPLPDTMLSDMDSRIAAYAGTGARLLIGFEYCIGPAGPDAQDAPINVISTNIDQIAPILLKPRFDIRYQRRLYRPVGRVARFDKRERYACGAQDCSRQRAFVL